jgi:hypothetical protein
MAAVIWRKVNAIGLTAALAFLEYSRSEANKSAITRLSAANCRARAADARKLSPDKWLLDQPFGNNSGLARPPPTAPSPEYFH